MHLRHARCAAGWTETSLQEILYVHVVKLQPASINQYFVFRPVRNIGCNRVSLRPGAAVMGVRVAGMALHYALPTACRLAGPPENKHGYFVTSRQRQEPQVHCHLVHLRSSLAFECRIRCFLRFELVPTKRSKSAGKKVVAKTCNGPHHSLTVGRSLNVYSQRAVCCRLERPEAKGRLRCHDSVVQDNTTCRLCRK